MNRKDKIVRAFDATVNAGFGSWIGGSFPVVGEGVYGCDFSEFEFTFLVGVDGFKLESIDSRVEIRYSEIDKFTELPTLLDVMDIIKSKDVNGLLRFKILMVGGKGFEIILPYIIYAPFFPLLNKLTSS